MSEINAEGIEINFDFNYFNEIITWVDTLKITKVIEKGISFYRSFGFGAVGIIISVLK